MCVCDSNLRTPYCGRGDCVPSFSFANKCLVCGVIVPMEHEQFFTLNGAICMGCEGKKITVYHITLPCDKGGYYDTDMNILTELFVDCSYGEGYTVIKEQMLAIKYYNLPEFTGF